MTDLYSGVLEFYARQMPLMEEGRIEEYADTFTEDGVFEHALGWRLEGREQLIEGTRSGLARYAGKALRHWHDRFTVDRRPDGALDVTYLAMVSLVDEQGQVTFEPSCTVRDVLVWSQEGAGGGRWRTRSRAVHVRDHGSHRASDQPQGRTRRADARHAARGDGTGLPAAAARPAARARQGAARVLPA
nr:nuclear transport factor 2 family protein [Actinospica acidiphila]